MQNPRRGPADFSEHNLQKAFLIGRYMPAVGFHQFNGEQNEI